MTRSWLLLLVACGSSPHGEPPDGSKPADAAIDGAPPMNFPTTLTVPATHGTIQNTFAATIAGSGTGDLGTIGINANTGTIQLDGESGQTALYNTVPFSGYQIFGSMVVSPDRWSVAYPYCMGNTLTDVYAENVGPGGFVLFSASGSCNTITNPTPTTVDLPSFTIPTPPAFGNATVHGAQIDLDHGTGTLEGKPAVVFNTVDCSTTCGSPGWYELHTLVWDDAAKTAAFVIVYLEIQSPTSVQLSYGLRLPNLDDPFGDVILSATWSGTAARTLDVEPPHLPPPWLKRR